MLEKSTISPIELDARTGTIKSYLKFAFDNVGTTKVRNKKVIFEVTPGFMKEMRQMALGMGISVDDLSGLSENGRWKDFCEDQAQNNT